MWPYQLGEWPGAAADPTPHPHRAPPQPVPTCAVLLQPPDLSVEPLESAGMFPLEEEQVLLRTVQLVLQVCGCHADMQVTCRKHKTLVTVWSMRAERRWGSRTLLIAEVQAVDSSLTRQIYVRTS